MNFSGIINLFTSAIVGKSPALERKPFSEINSIVYPKLENPGLFNCEDINLLKVVQHGLVYSYINDSSKLVRPFWKYPQFVVTIILFFKRVIFYSGFSEAKKYLSALQKRKYLTTEINRPVLDENNKYVSRFMHNVFSTLGRDNCFNILTLRGTSHTEVDHDLLLNNINRYFELVPLGKEDKLLLKNLKKSFTEIRNSGRFTDKELKYIDSQYHIFWLNYRVFSRIVDAVQPKTCILIPHYHKEALIAVLKKRSIPAIELQHASFVTEHLYYLYPPFISRVASNALFADHILVFGKFWKDYLLKGAEYPVEKINIVGNYIYSRPAKESEIREFLSENIPQEKKIILLTTQKKLTKYFIDYIHFLAPDLKKKYPGYHIIVKAHPGEDNVEQYELNHLYDNYLFVKKETNLGVLMAISNIHVSIYSTTLYDALGYNIVNFSLISGTIADDYARRMIEDGISFPLGKNENPVDKLNEIEAGMKDKKRGDFFADFDPKILINAVTH